MKTARAFLPERWFFTILLFILGLASIAVFASGPQGLNPVIREFEPAVAVRAAGCITCHAKFDSLVVGKFISDQCDANAYRASARSLIHACNAVCLDSLSMTVTLMSEREEDEILRYWALLDQIAENEKQEEQRLTIQLDSLMARHENLIQAGKEEGRSVQPAGPLAS